jgi:hypothetical protein
MHIESIAGRCKLAAQCLTTSGFYAHSLGSILLFKIENSLVDY